MVLPPAFHESLPYIDGEPSPQALEAASALIAAEGATRKPSPPADKLRLSPAMAMEMARVASHTPLASLDLSRYEAQDHSSQEDPRSRLENASVSAAYLIARDQNLSLLDAHGANAWLLANYHLQHTLAALERDLADAKRRIDLVNARRASAQTSAAPELLMLQDSWRRGVARVLETELAVEDLKAQIRRELRDQSAAGTA